MVKVPVVVQWIARKRSGTIILVVPSKGRRTTFLFQGKVRRSGRGRGVRLWRRRRSWAVSVVSDLQWLFKVGHHRRGRLERAPRSGLGRGRRTRTRAPGPRPNKGPSDTSDCREGGGARPLRAHPEPAYTPTCAAGGGGASSVCAGDAWPLCFSRSRLAG